MRSNWLYLATRSVRLSEPVLILAGVRGYSDIGDSSIFRFTRTMTDNCGIVVLMSQFHRVQCFCQGTDLVHFDEDGVGNAFLNAFCAGT